MKYINKNVVAKLKTLIVSGDINDETKIQIFNKMGHFVAAGKWYNDNILDYMEKFGTFTKVGSGNSISFHLQ